jgi:hypothetical protein
MYFLKFKIKTISQLIFTIKLCAFKMFEIISIKTFFFVTFIEIFFFLIINALKQI